MAKRRYKFSALFLRRLKLYDGTFADLANKCGIHPVKLSRYIHGVDPVTLPHPRLTKLGRLVGLKRRQLFKWIRD